MELLARYGVPTRGARAVVLGRSTLVGLHMALLLATNGPAATLTVAHSRTAALAAEVGMTSRHSDLPASATQREVEHLVRTLAADPAVHGILVQLPLPAGLDEHAVIDLIPPEKDVDGLTTVSLGRLVRGQAGLVPCTPRGCMELLARYGVPTRGARAVVLGRSTLVGLPMALLLATKGTDATVTVAHSRTAELAAVCREADILVSAVGVAGIVTADHVKPGAAVLDVGISRTEAGLVGDVAFAEVSEVAGWLTPMPGGTGPMTIALLLRSAVKAARYGRGILAYPGL
jgi:methylenetetrahydrofolate dehydrogenase (NADP+)/methenyltetrahydrofolate cyclohydrolase